MIDLVFHNALRQTGFHVQLGSDASNQRRQSKFFRERGVDFIGCDKGGVSQ